MVTADVWHLLDQIGAPGTRVLQSAFDGHSDNPHLPENYVTNTVAYTGTHDNPTTRRLVREAVATRAAKSVAISETVRRRRRGCRARAHASGVVVQGRAGDHTAAGPAQPRDGSVRQRPGHSFVELVLARHRRDAERPRFRLAAAVDERRQEGGASRPKCRLRRINRLRRRRETQWVEPVLKQGGETQ